MTFLFTPTGALFYRSGALPEGAMCGNPLAGASLFCVRPPHESPAARTIALSVLGLVVIGLLPGVVTWLHAWVAWSFYTATSTPDGGDQVAGMLALLLVLMYFGDMRLTHWRPHGARMPPTSVQFIRHLARPLIAAQAVVVYGHAFIGKLAVDEWLNGTDFWYWIQDGPFRPPWPLDGIYAAASSTLAGSLLLNWGPLALEAALMAAVVLPKRFQVRLWWLAVAFHVAIAFTFGLASFLCSMAALLTLYLLEPTAIQLAKAAAPAAAMGVHSKAQDRSAGRQPDPAEVTS
jgi:antimicrobial peptide system SdpB family protein